MQERFCVHETSAGKLRRRGTGQLAGGIHVLHTLTCDEDAITCARMIK